MHTVTLSGALGLIKVEQLVYEYPGHRALDGVSLEIARGSVTALVGPNGAGKSTLMRCIAGLDRPLSGQIWLNGLSVQEQPREVHRHLGYLSDFYGLYDRLSVNHCLRYAAKAMGLPEAQVEARVAEVASQLDLTALLQRLPTELSRGQRQRLAIGQAIVHQPQVLLLDEPASGLDPEARSSLAQLFRRLQAQGMTLVVSSHILSELDEYCSHILSIRAGHIESHAALGAVPDTALQRYALELAGPTPPERLLPWLSPQAEIEWPTESLCHLWLPGEAQARADWLAQLLAAGLPVSGLWPLRERLQDRYARGQRAGSQEDQP